MMTDEFKSQTGMSTGRYAELMNEQSARINADERLAGWHFCRDFDGLLVGPGMPELESCRCMINRELYSSGKAKGSQ